MRKLIFALVLFLLCMTVVAQDFPPDPTDFLIGNIEIVNVEFYTYPVPIDSTAPYINQDTRVVQIYDEETDTSQAIPYPEEIPEDINPFIKSHYDGTYYIQAWNIGAWTIHTDTLTYEPIDLVCNTEVPDAPDESRWLLIKREETQTVHICNTSTGDLSEALPNEHWWNLGEPDESPDGDWLILFGFEAPDENSRPITYLVYSYHLSNSELRYLGKFDAQRLADYPPNPRGNWISNTQTLLYYTTSGESYSNYYYVVDLTKPDSVELMHWGWSPNYNKTDQRHEYMQTDGFITRKTGGQTKEHFPCELIVYDARGIFRHELGYDCLGARYVSAGDTFYTVVVDGNPESRSSLIQIDITTGDVQEILSGIIEGVMAVSSDNRYLIVAKGNGDTIQRTDFYEIPYDGIRNDPFFAPVGSVDLAVYDMQTNTYIYEFTWGNSWGDISVGDCGDNCYIFILDYETQLHIKPSGEVEVLSEGLFTLSPDHTKAIINRDGVIGVLYLAENHFFPLHHEGVTPYNMSTSWRDDTTIAVRVSLPETNDTPSQSAIYEITLSN